VQPSDHPRSDHEADYECMEIMNHRVVGRTAWELQAQYEDNHQKFQPYSVWASVQDVWKDCDEGDDDENLVMKYIQTIEQCPRGLKEAIGKICGRDLVAEGQEAKKKASNHNHVIIEENCTCQMKHNESSSFVKIDENYYFQKGRKFHGLPCMTCKNDPGPASCRNPVFVCQKLHLDKAECDKILCGKCHMKLLVASSPVRTNRRIRNHDAHAGKK
jgi:hypothetical protein